MRPRPNVAASISAHGVLEYWSVGVLIKNLELR